jgi:hypothetical protein
VGLGGGEGGGRDDESEAGSEPGDVLGNRHKPDQSTQNHDDIYQLAVNHS